MRSISYYYFVFVTLPVTRPSRTNGALVNTMKDKLKKIRAAVFFNLVLYYFFFHKVYRTYLFRKVDIAE